MPLRQAISLFEENTAWVADVIFSHFWNHLVQGGCDGVAKGLAGSCLLPTEPMFELGEKLLDLVQVGTVCVREVRVGPGRLDGLPYSLAL